MPDNEKFFDDLLDASLRVNAIPREGLEQRILAHVATAGSQLRLRWFRLPRFALATAMAALLAVAFWIGSRSTNNRLEQTPPVASITVPEVTVPKVLSTSPAEPVSTSVKRGSAAADIAVDVPLRAQTFPAPAQLSEQEQLLLAYLRRTPRSEVAFNSKPDPPREDVPVEMNFAVPAQHSTYEATK